MAPAACENLVTLAESFTAKANLRSVSLLMVPLASAVTSVPVVEFPGAVSTILYVGSRLYVAVTVPLCVGMNVMDLTTPGPPLKGVVTPPAVIDVTFWSVWGLAYTLIVAPGLMPASDVELVPLTVGAVCWIETVPPGTCDTVMVKVLAANVTLMLWFRRRLRAA